MYICNICFDHCTRLRIRLFSRALQDFVNGRCDSQCDSLLPGLVGALPDSYVVYCCNVPEAV